MIIYGDGRNFTATLHRSGLYGRETRLKPLLSGEDTHLEFAKKHLNDSLRLRNIIFWSDETRHCSSTVKCSGGKIMAYGQLCECP